MDQFSKIFLQRLPTIYHWYLYIDDHKINHTHHMSCDNLKIINKNIWLSMQIKA